MTNMAGEELHLIMKQTLTGILLVLVAAAIFNIFSFSTYADNGATYSFAPPPITVCEDVTKDEVRVGYDLSFYADGVDYYMFLPSTADLGSVKIRYDGDKVLYDQFTCQTFEKGSELRIPLSLGENTICEYDPAEDKYYVYSFVVMAANNSKAVYISLDGGWDDLQSLHYQKSNYAAGYIRVTGSDGKDKYNGRLDKIKGRGWSSYAPTNDVDTKNGYNIKLGSKAQLLDDAAKSKKWSLISIRQWISDGSTFDNSTIRPSGAIFDQTGLSYLNAFYTYNALVKDAYNNICGEYVDVYINGQYRGVYIIAQKMDNGGVFQIRDLDNLNTYHENWEHSRIYVNEGMPDDEAIKAGVKWYIYDDSSSVEKNIDITGGYVLVASSNGQYMFCTKHGVSFEVKSPEYPSREEMIYISTFVQHFEDALYSPTGYNGLGIHYSEYMDTESLEALILVYAYYLNWEFFRTSTYIYKDADTPEGVSRLVCGPVWDFEGKDLSKPNMFGDYMVYYIECQYTWLEQVWQHGEIMSGMHEMNAELKKVIETLLGDRDTDMIYTIDSINDNYLASQEMNWQRWRLSDSYTAGSDKLKANIRTRYDTWYGVLWDDPKWLEGVYIEGEDNKDGTYTFSSHVIGTNTGDIVWYRVGENYTDLIEISRGESSIDVTGGGLYLCAVNGLNNAYASDAAGSVFSSETITMYSNTLNTDDLSKTHISEIPQGETNWSKYRSGSLNSGLGRTDTTAPVYKSNRRVPLEVYENDLSKGELLEGEIIGDLIGNDGTETTGRTAAFDKDPNTFFDPVLGIDYYYCGLDTETPHILTKVRILQRPGYPHRFKGATIQGSNDMVKWYNMYTSDHVAQEGEWEEVTDFECNIGFRYYRYVNKTEHGNVAELEFYGVDGQLASSPEEFGYSVPVDYVKVFYDANGGNVKNDYSIVKRGGAYGGMDKPQRTGYVFEGWYTEPEGGVKIEETSEVNAIGDFTVYAHWTQATDEEVRSGKLRTFGIIGIVFILIFGGAVFASRMRNRY